MYICNGFLQGLGKSLEPMITSIVGVCGLRILWLLTAFRLPQFHNANGHFAFFSASYLAVASILVFVVRYEMKK